MQLLRGNRSFRRLLTGQVVSELGSWFDFIAVLGLVRTVSAGSAQATALIIFLRLAPFAVFAPVAGALADRWSRRTVMIVSDVGRALVVLGFLFVRKPEDLWIAYSCTIIGSLLGALFEAAKNGAVPNLAGDRGLLAANALMFSSRFLLMAVGAALGGATAARFGYAAAFVVDALSFLISAYYVWLIPGHEMRQQGEAQADADPSVKKPRVRVFADMREGWTYIVQHKLVFALIGVNIMWATGGGACNLLYERLGAVVFAEGSGAQADANVAALYTVVGAGLFIGMMLARRIGAQVELHGATASFMGWMLIAHGILFALAGLMPTLWLAGAMLFLSRLVVAIEFAVQETLLMRMLPDGLRGRVFTTDRAAEILVMSLSMIAAGWSLRFVSTRTLTVISGLLSASPGVVWLILFAMRRLSLPRSAEEGGDEVEEKEAVLVSAS